jgi:hypothetical protein
VKAEDELKALEEQLKPNEADYGGKKAGLGIADSDLGKKGPNPETVQ